MKKVLAYFVILISLAIYITSASDKLTKCIAKKRFFSNSLFSSDKYRFGDLYGRTFLPGFKDIQSNQPLEVKPQLYGLSGKKIIDLYTIHDSYLMRENIQGNMDTMVQGLHKYVDIKWWKNLEGGVSSASIACLDSSKENILVIEVTERNLLHAFSTTEIIDNRLKTKSNENSERNNSEKTLILWYYLPYALPNPALEDNLQFNMFDYHIFTPIMELKAWLNYKLFGRTIDKAVTVSSDNEYLYWSETLSDGNGSFSQITDKEIDHIVQMLNDIYIHYKKAGFNEVFFSAIPNPVVILNTENRQCNRLIPRIQKDANLKIPIINAYEILKDTKYKVFTKGESHWTRDGFQLWLNELNKKIAERVNKDSKE